MATEFPPFVYSDFALGSTVLNYELSGIQYLLSLNFIQQDSLAEENDMVVVLLSIITAGCYSSLSVADAKNPIQVNLYK